MDTLTILVPHKKEKRATALLDLAIHGKRVKSYKKKKHKNGIAYTIKHDGDRETQAALFRGLKVAGGIEVSIIKESKKQLDLETHANLVNTTRNSLIRSQKESKEADSAHTDVVSDDDEEIRKNHEYSNNQFYQKFYNESIEIYESIHTYHIKDRKQMGELIKFLRDNMKLTNQDFTLNGNPIDTIKCRNSKAKQAIAKFYGNDHRAHKLRVMGEDTLSERKLSDTEKKKKEDIVKSMKKNKKDFKSRYGDDWKSVMYATATKHAKSNS